MISADDLELERAAAQVENDSDLASAGLAYAALGWAVFPLSGRRTPLAGSHGYRDASCSPEIIRRLFSQPEARGLAIATGVSKLVVLDVDPRNGGEKTAAEKLAGRLDPHPVKRTPRGGRHLVFRAPVLSKIATRANALGPGIDVEAAGAGVMFAPPTAGYHWEISPFHVPPPHLPLWLWRLLPKVEARRPAGPRGGPRRLPVSTGEAIDLLARLGRVRKSAGGWLALCPAHADRHQSLSIMEGSDGQPVLHCFADCSFSEIVAALLRLKGVA